MLSSWRVVGFKVGDRTVETEGLFISCRFAGSTGVERERGIYRIRLVWRGRGGDKLGGNDRGLRCQNHHVLT